MKKLGIFIAVFLTLSAVGCDKKETSPAPTSAVVDPVVAALTNVTTLELATSICSSVPAFPAGDDRSAYDACYNKLVSLIQKEKMLDFDSSLSFLKKETKGGRPKTIRASAAQEALRLWVLQNSATADKTTLNRWYHALPTEEDDREFVFMSVRNAINQALKK
jgi:hypothetical protein